MTPTFAVGEVAIGQNITWEEYNGMECTITSGLEDRLVVNAVTFGREVWTGYGVRWASGVESFQAPDSLRKRRPSESDDAIERQAMLDCIERAKTGIEVSA